MSQKDLNAVVKVEQVPSESEPDEDSDEQVVVETKPDSRKEKP